MSILLTVIKVANGYKKISAQINVPLSSVGVVVYNCKFCNSIPPLIHSGCLCKLAECTARKFARTSSKTPQTTPKELQEELEAWEVHVGKDIIRLLRCHDLFLLFSKKDPIAEETSCLA